MTDLTSRIIDFLTYAKDGVILTHLLSSPLENIITELQETSIINNSINKWIAFPF